MRSVVSGVLKLLLLRMAIVSIGVFSSVATAQVQSAPLEEILVTARNWEENIRKVPIAMNAFSEEDIERLNIMDLSDLAALTTSAEYVGDNGNPFDNQLIIRGGGVGRFFGVDGGTGLYANGINVQGGNMGGKNLWNLDRFDARRYEVLKGPQGALYGRNALGGAVSVNSIRPNTRGPSLRIRGGLYDNEGYEAALFANIPIVKDTFALRLAGRYYDQDKGFYKNTVDGEYIDDIEKTNLRLSALWKPSSDWTVWFQYDYFDAELWGSSTYDTIAVSDPFRRHTDDPNEGSKDEESYFASLEGDLGWAVFTLLMNHRERDAYRTFDFDQGVSQDPFDRTMQVPCYSRNDPQPNNRCTDTQFGNFEKDGAEARLVGTHGALRWSVGADTFTSNDDWYYNALGRGSKASFRAHSNSDVTSWAVYGGGEYALSDDWQLGLELRQTREEKDISDRATGDGPNLDFIVFDTSLDETWDYTTWAVHSSYDFSDRVRTYARVGTGLRGSGLNSDPRDVIDPDTGEPVVVPDSYAEERAISYEVGLKSLFLDGAWSVDASTYYVDYEDYLSNGNNGLGGVDRVVFVFNRGDIAVLGAEFGTQYSFNVGAVGISMRGGASWSDSELSDTVNSLSNPDPDSDNLEVARLPQWTYRASLRMDVPVGALKVFGDLRYSGQKGGYQTFSNGTDLPEPHLLDLRMGVGGKGWRLTGHVSNLTDEGEPVRFVTPSSSTSLARKPRTWWLTAQYDFL